MTTENGVKEAVATLKDNVKTLFEQIYEIEKRGCSVGRVHDEQVKKLDEEVTTMKEKFDEMRVLLYKLVGATIVLAWIGSFVANIVVKML